MTTPRPHAEINKQWLDSELIELSAKAAGWTGWQSKHGYWNVKSPEGEDFACCNNWFFYDQNTGNELPQPTFADALAELVWNPLDDDGDALRLAVKMSINIVPNYYAEWQTGTGDTFKAGRVFTTETDHDSYTATRRAIVQAAAHIGGLK